MTAPLTRAEIMGAVRIRKLLDKAASVPGTPEAGAYAERARTLAAKHPRGHDIIYKGKPVLEGDTT